MIPVPVRLTPEQAQWLQQQTSAGCLSRSAAVRLCVQAAMASGRPLAAMLQATAKERR